MPDDVISREDTARAVVAGVPQVLLALPGAKAAVLGAAERLLVPAARMHLGAGRGRVAAEAWHAWHASTLQGSRPEAAVEAALAAASAANSHLPRLLRLPGDALAGAVRSLAHGWEMTLTIASEFAVAPRPGERWNALPRTVDELLG